MDEDSLDKYDPAYGKRQEFRGLVRESGRTLNELMFAQVEGAENLLTKAAAALAANDPQRAERLIERAAEMPYNERELESPGLRAAQNLLFRLVSDRLEESGQDDDEWLEVALAVHERLDGAGKAELASQVNGFVLQKAYYDLTPTETRRIKQAVGDAPLNVDFGDGPDISVGQRRDIIRSIMLAVRALEDAYASADSSGTE